VAACSKVPMHRWWHCSSTACRHVDALFAKISQQEAKRGLGTTAVFIARNRFAVLDKGANQIQIRNLQNEVSRRASRAA
jgi:hypothetical protein